MTGHPGSGSKGNEFGDFTDTAFIGVEAAAVENATGGQVDGRGNFAF
jgi:predicted homoserine dehydrogenase-like protein